MKKLVILLFLIAPSFIVAQEISLFRQYNGRYDFLAFGNVLNEGENNDPGTGCTILTESSAEFSLQPGQTLVAATLYWSGSGTGDFNVELNNIPLSAERTFSHDVNGLPFFAAYADVTGILASFGNNTYTLSELDLTAVIGNYCPSLNYGGWAINVIYRDPSLRLNQISLFDGLDSVSAANPSLEIILQNIDIATQDLAKIGFLAWEGDNVTPPVNESLRINGTLMSNAQNPPDNAFNGTNSYTGATDFYNADLDVYDIEAVVMPGDTDITINLTSELDLVLVNNVITSVNSEIPDATIEIDNTGVFCVNGEINVDYTVFNVNSTAPLPAGTPIAFYADAVLIGQTQTVSAIAIGGFETGLITLNIPAGTPGMIDLRAVVDDDGTGMGIVPETDESNNEFVLPLDLNQAGLFLGEDIEGCVGTPVILDTLIADPGFEFDWFFNGVEIIGEDGPTLSVSVNGTYRVFGVKGFCEVEDEINVNFNDVPIVNPNPGPLVLCDANNDGFAMFDLTLAEAAITGGDPTVTVSYHGTFLDAENEVLPLTIPYQNDVAYNDVPVTDSMDPLFGTGGVWARVESLMGNCFEVVPFALEVRDSPVATTPAGPLRMCDDSIPDGITIFDLTVVAPEVLGSLPATEFDLYYYENEAEAIVAGDNALSMPDFSMAIITPGAYQNTGNPQTIYILVVGNSNSTMPNNGANGCYDIVELELIVDPLPEDLGPFEILLCDDELNGSLPDDNISTFDLTSQNGPATGGNILYTVSWYETPADEAADLPIADPTMYQNFATPQTVIGRVTSEFGCQTTFTMTLEVLPNPEPNMTPTPLELCDDDDDGLVGGFMLTDRDAEIIAMQPDVNILYYESQQEAIDATPGTAIISPYTNTTPNTQIVYARVTNNVPPSQLECFTIVELTLNVIALPDMPDATFGFEDPFQSCDASGDGLATFDLTLQNAGVLGSQTATDFAPITYYTTEADAMIPDNEINPDTAFISAGQTIWVRLESLDTGCARITPFEIIVGTFPTIGVGDDLFACDDELFGSTPTDGLSTFDLTVNTELIQLGDETLVVSYYKDAADQAADIPIATPESYQNELASPQEIFVNVLNAEGCIAPGSFFITVEPNPAAIVPEPLIACDDDNDGFYTQFMLEDKDVEISNGETDVSISYYISEVDAQVGDPLDMLMSPYSNIIAFSQTVYARVVRNTPPGVNPCVTIVSMELRVELLPNDPDPVTFQDPLEVCDDNDDGIAVFDLTQNTDPVLSTQVDPTEFLPVSYYESETDADMGINAIDPADTMAYSNTSNPQTIWVRVENSITGCYLVSTFELRVNALPVLGMGPFELVECDDEQNGSTPTDGISTFDLTTINGAITDGNTDYSVFYYLTQEDQDNDLPIVDPTNHQNLDSDGNAEIVQDLFVSVFTDRGCEGRTNLTIRVLPNPTPNQPEPLRICDGSGGVGDEDPTDGISLFDLPSKDAEIIGGEPDVSVSYYESLALAEEGDLTMAIDTSIPYENTTSAGSQLIYVRVERDVPPGELGCFTIVTLELIVDPLPDGSSELTNLIACEFVNDGIAIFDLTQKDEQVLMGQDPLLFDVLYFISEGAAQAGVSPILNPTGYANTSNPQRIYVRIENNQTDCAIASETDITTGITSLSFELEVKEAAQANTPALPYEICDNLDASDGIGRFTLKSNASNPTELDAQSDALAAEILGGQDPSIYILTYHETLENAELGVDPLPDLYDNIINPQIIYARVTNEVDPLDEMACFDIVEVILKVDQLPVVVLEEEYRLCTDGGVAIPEVEGESSPPVIDTGLDPSLYTFIWTINGTIAANETGEFIVALVAGSYEVTITELDSGCSTTLSTTVIESSPPQVFDVDVVTGAFDNNATIEATVSEGAGVYEYQLDDGPFQQEGVFMGVEPGDHTVTIKDVNGCGSVTVEVGVIDYPEFVTPNGDGFHDTWNIIGIASGDPTAKIYIFDRYGKLLKQISPQGPGWDGTYNGNPLPSSDYWFRVEYTEDETAKEFRGHFTLKR